MFTSTVRAVTMTSSGQTAEKQLLLFPDGSVFTRL